MNTKTTTAAINFNALSLRDLRAMLPTTRGVATPNEAWVREHKEDAICTIQMDDSQIMVFPNGFYTYCRESRISILRVDGFSKITYDFANGEKTVIQEADYIDRPFVMALEINGSNQWERNADKRNTYSHEYSIDGNEDEWRREFQMPSAEDLLICAEDEKEERLRLKKALETLTERQKEMVRMYFYEGMTQKNAAKALGITRQTGNEILASAIKRLRNNF